MNRSIRRALGVGGLSVVAAALVAAPAARRPVRTPPVQDFLAEQLSTLTGATTTVMVHGTDIAAARAAVDADRDARRSPSSSGSASSWRRAPPPDRGRPHPAGRDLPRGQHPDRVHAGDLQHRDPRRRGGRPRSPAPTARPLDGSGVSVAVIDSGVDPTHPYFQDADGTSAVVANLKSAVPRRVRSPSTDCVVQRARTSSTPTRSPVGGHGTHVNGIVAGRPTTLTDGGQLQGAAPGASLVSISTGAVLLIVGADSALNWVLENHEAPCGAGVSAADLPADQGHQQLLRPDRRRRVRPELGDGQAAAGAGRRGRRHGLGGRQRRRRRLGESLTNPPGQDPTGGILSVASYYDQDTGTRDGVGQRLLLARPATDPSTWPDLSAPGENITSSCRLYLPICSTGLDPRNGPALLDIGTFNTISGTSMAAPHIAGIVAQLFQADPTATPAEIEAALKGTAHRFTDGAAYTPVGGYSTSYDKGTGLVDVVAAVGATGRRVRPGSEGGSTWEPPSLVFHVERREDGVNCSRRAVPRRGAAGAAG